MGYFYDGAFKRALYSVKETGRKLKDGAMEVVEHFLSGYNGYGWKIWERNGRYRMEIDELFVRGSLTTYEQIISKITSIKGSQAITQAHGTIKSVESVQSADVHVEVLSSGVYTDTIIQKACYQISLEEEVNSIREYDFIRCQKGGRMYHVQVGSVYQNYVNIPLDEFETDPETGVVLTPPQVGDELVQFGNASHMDDYKYRHSAIYLHTDDSEPAIDLMTDIYSKDWSGTIKVRVGCNLPGTDGDKGFFAENGRLLFTDSNGQVISTINPDGSASFAYGKLSWTAGGSPKFSGTMQLINGDKVWEVDEFGKNTIGIRNGKRIELSSETEDLKIYDDNGEPTSVFEGNKYNELSELFDNTADVVDIKNVPLQYIYTMYNWRGTKRTELTDKFQTEGLIALAYNYHITFTRKITSSAIATFYLRVYVENYATSTSTTPSSELTFFSKSYNVVFDDETVDLDVTKLSYLSIPSGYHIIKIEVVPIPTKDPTSSNDRLTIDITSFNVSAVSSSGLSRYFGNGLVHGDDLNNIFSLINNPSTGIQFDLRNKSNGISLDGRNIYSYRLGIRGNLPSTILSAEVYTDTTKYGWIKSSPVDFIFMPDPVRTAEGKCRIRFPEQWYNYGISNIRCYVMLTGIGFVRGSTNSPVIPVFGGWVTNSLSQTIGFDVFITNGSIYKDGDFYFELKIH